MMPVAHILLSFFRPGEPQLLLLLALVPAVVGLVAARWSRLPEAPGVSSGSLFCCLLFVVLLLDQLDVPLAQLVHYPLPIGLLIFATVAVANLFFDPPGARIFARSAGATFFVAMLIGLVRWHLESQVAVLDSFGSFSLTSLLFGFALLDSDLGSSSERKIARVGVGGAVAALPALFLTVLATQLINFEALHPTPASSVALVFAAYLGVRVWLPVPARWRRAVAPLVPAALLALMAVNRSGAVWFGSGIVAILAMGGPSPRRSPALMGTRVRLRLAVIVAATGLFAFAGFWGGILDARAVQPVRETRRVLIPAGPFWSGCSDSDFKCEEGRSPGHPASVADPYEIDQDEVAVEQYRACVIAGRCTTAGLREPVWFKGEHRPDFGWSCNWQVPGRERHPINCVSWYQASDYCRWRGGELPTGEQYEKAARGALDQRDYPWGSNGFEGAPRANIADMSALARFQKRYIAQAYDDGFEATAPVGSYPAGRSPYGVNDLVGNVEEWSLDWDDEEKGWKSIRGGSWHRPPAVAHIARHYPSPASGQPDYGGFRCVYEAR